MLIALPRYIQFANAVSSLTPVSAVPASKLFTAKEIGIVSLISCMFLCKFQE